MSLNILFIGDIIGERSLYFLNSKMHILRSEYKPDLIIANAENVSGGKGCIEKDGNKLFEMGIGVLTSGNHVFDKEKSVEFLEKEQRFIRPLNYPEGVKGRGKIIMEIKGIKIAIANLQGRVFMNPIDCPFRTAERFVNEARKIANIIIIDFHAEATAEKMAMLYFLDGKVSAIIGTHTHIQTSDERITSRGTAYITDVGMTGPYDSVIGMKSEAALNKFLYQTPQYYQIAENDMHISALFVKIDEVTGKARFVERIFFPKFNANGK